MKQKQSEDVKYFMLAQDLPQNPQRCLLVVLFNTGTTRVIIQGLYDKKKVFEFSDSFGEEQNKAKWKELRKLIRIYEQSTDTMQ